MNSGRTGGSRCYLHSATDHGKGKRALGPAVVKLCVYFEAAFERGIVEDVEVYIGGSKDYITD